MGITRSYRLLVLPCKRLWLAAGLRLSHSGALGTHTMSGSCFTDSLSCHTPCSWGLLPPWLTLAAGPILLASTSELSWTQSDYSFWHKHSSCQERTSLPQAQPRSTLSSLRVGTSWEALSSLVSPTNPEKKDRPGWVHLNWREVTYPPPPSNLHSGWGRCLTFHCLLSWLFRIPYLIKSSE